MLTRQSSKKVHLKFTTVFIIIMRNYENIKPFSFHDSEHFFLKSHKTRVYIFQHIAHNSQRFFRYRSRTIAPVHFCATNERPYLYIPFSFIAVCDVCELWTFVMTESWKLAIKRSRRMTRTTKPSLVSLKKGRIRASYIAFSGVLQ